MLDRIKNSPFFRWIFTILLVVFLLVVISLGQRSSFERPASAPPEPTPPADAGLLATETAEALLEPGEDTGQTPALTPTVPRILEQFLATPEETPTFTDPAAPPEATAVIPPAAPSEWNQDAANPQRTGYIHEEPELPWELIWTWNGPDERGGNGNHFYDAPPEARTITGGEFVFAPAGDLGLFAIRKSDGSQAWNFTSSPVNAAPAYDLQTGILYIGGADGSVYQVEGQSGEILNTYETGSPINKSILLAERSIYALNVAGELHKVQEDDFLGEWVYQAGAEASTPPAFSWSASVIVFASDDLFIHAVDAETGAERWRANPSPNPPRFPYTFYGYWPVIAEQHEIVFFRMNLGMDGLWSGPEEGQKYPATNAEIRQYLIENSQLKNLFALDLQTGEERFIPAVGYGGVEMLVGEDTPDLITGPVPVIKPLPEGGEAAYMFFRNGQSPHQDGRWDSHIGEMVLDDQTIPGLEAGDLRFVQFRNSYVHISDEQCPLTMAGDTLFHAHWGASESTTITNRSTELGLTYDNPIRSQSNPVVIRRMQACPDYNPETHWTTCGLTLFDDGRFWNGPGWWVYWDTLDPPTPSRRAYSEGILPRYTYVSDGLVIVQGNGGELLVFRHSGR
jgi:outer membrane protein assembly factor BamB